MSSSFDRSSSSSEEFFDACSGDENSCTEETDSLKQSVNETDKTTTKSDNELFVKPKAPPRKKKVNKVQDNNQLGIDNLINYVDDIASIHGDLSVTDVHIANQDRKSVYVDESLRGRKDLSDDIINKVVEENRLKESLNQQIKTSKDKVSLKQTNDLELDSSSNSLNQSRPQSVIQETIKEDDELSSTDCINPINLHLLKITNDYDNDGEIFEDS